MTDNTFTSGKKHSRSTLVVIGILKIGKALLMILLGLGLFGLLGQERADRVQHWVWQMRPGFAADHLNRWLAKLLSLPEKSKLALDAAAFLYAALFATEGIGLILAKRWAEWMTVITTGLLVPLEIYEIYERPQAIVRIVVLVANVAILIYLVWRIRADRHAKPA